MSNRSMRQEELLDKAVDLFKRFPGIGQRQAERFARFITRSDGIYVRQLADVVIALHAASKQCPQCFIRHQCSNDRCDHCLLGHTDTLIVVEKDVDVAVLAVSIGTSVQGYYFVLGGLIPIANSDEMSVRMPQLLQSIETHIPSEIIIALSAHPDADHTARYLTNTLQQHFPSVTITTLGRGLSSGSELEYSDPETLQNAFTHRNSQSSKYLKK